eukprot:CAMPEP_0169103894 /NCGR_PEP_ID=MMETSP1015-20121227/22969_1 /TAXON_ID=342587 /ORGANISM="Karlodinium micrum, Strain CCMP2283" /LENGTH=230 /DNA_ID=CAMNT_0009165143 /DNA_START=79 /DNA_END=771 /DNA_ORIENTATION=+
MALSLTCQIAVAFAMLCGVVADDSRELAVAYNISNPCATAAPVSPCGTVAPVTTVTTTPASPCGTVAPVTTVTTTPASPCGTVAPVATVTTTPAATYTTTPAATYTTTPAATVTTTPAATYTTTPAATITTTPAGTVAPASPCGTVAPAAKFAAKKVSDAEKGNASFIQGAPITVGLVSLLLVSAVVGMIVRVARSNSRSTRLTFNGRRLSRDEGAYALGSDVESQHFLE